MDGESADEGSSIFARMRKCERPGIAAPLTERRYVRAMQSISIRAPRGSAATATVERAGLLALK